MTPSPDITLTCAAILLSMGLGYAIGRLKRRDKDMENLKQGLDALALRVEENLAVTGSAVALLNGLTVMLQEALASGGTPQEILDQVAALTAQVEQDSATLAAAVAANTPAEDEPA